MTVRDALEVGLVVSKGVVTNYGKVGGYKTGGGGVTPIKRGTQKV